MESTPEVPHVPPKCAKCGERNGTPQVPVDLEKYFCSSCKSNEKKEPKPTEKEVKEAKDYSKSPMTCKSGAGVLLFDSPRTKVALVLERGKWKMLTGTTELGERVSQTVIRETKDEVGVDLDPESLHEVAFLNTGTPEYNYFLIIYEAVLKDSRVERGGSEATPDVLKPDGVEIKEAGLAPSAQRVKWFPVSELLNTWREAKVLKEPPKHYYSHTVTSKEGNVLEHITLAMVSHAMSFSSFATRHSRVDSFGTECIIFSSRPKVGLW